MVTRSLFILLGLLYAVPSSALTYAAYRPWALGGARIIALGGAFAAVEDDASSIWISPAMIPQTNSGLDVVLTQGQAFSSEFQPQSLISSETTFRSSFDLISASFVLDKQWALALGDGDPYTEGPDNPIFSNSLLALHETRIALGKHITDRLSVSALAIYRTIKEKYSGYLGTSSQTIGSEQQANAWDMGVSLAWQMDGDWISSVSWESPRTFDLNNPSDLVTQSNGIQPVKIPSVSRLGVTRRWRDVRLLLSTEVDLWTDTAGLSAFIDSQYQGPQTFSLNSSILVPRVGVEHMFIERNWVKSWVRGGFYVEQPRVQQNRAREHWTVGVESKIWILDFNFGFDHASGYANAATSLGISLSDYL